MVTENARLDNSNIKVLLGDDKANVHLPSFRAEPISLIGLPPQAGITASNYPLGSVLNVERSVDGRTWDLVRGAVEVVMPEGGQLFVNDWSVPLGVLVNYRLTVNGERVATTTVRVPLQPGESWIQDAFSPQNGIQVTVDLAAGSAVYDANSFRTASWPQPYDEAQVMGASLPVESVGRRSRAGNIPLIIHTLAESDAARLRGLLFDSGILLIRGVGCDLLPANAFVVIPDIVETHLGNPHDVAMFAGHARLTREPSARLAIAFWTWEQVQDHVGETLGDNATYQLVQDTTEPATYDEIKADPTKLGALA